MVILLSKTSFIKTHALLLLSGLLLVACKSDAPADTDQPPMPLKPIVIDLEDAKSGTAYTVELDYPESWHSQMITNNVFRASENPQLVTDGFVNNFHVTVFADSLNQDLKWYSNDFLIKEQSKFSGTHFQIIRSEQLKSNRGIDFRLDYIKIWSGNQDTLFSVSALGKAKKRMVHLNFYGNYTEKEALESLARSVVAGVRVRG